SSAVVDRPALGDPGLVGVDGWVPEPASAALSRRAQARTTAIWASSKTDVAWPGAAVSSTRSASPAPHCRVSLPAVLSPTPDNTNIHWRAGAGCAESVQPAGTRMNSISRAGVVGDTPTDGAGGANMASSNDTSLSSK